MYRILINPNCDSEIPEEPAEWYDADDGPFDELSNAIVHAAITFHCAWRIVDDDYRQWAHGNYLL